MKKAFTLIEILVVATIIGLLAAVGAASYSQFMKQSRDSKRKADMENVRAALEMYRSNNSTYPIGSGWSTLNVLTSGTIYIKTLPSDPKNPTNSYYYTSDGTTYTVAAQLEAGGNSCFAGQCGANCNYCVGPYGQ